MPVLLKKPWMVFFLIAAIVMVAFFLYSPQKTQQQVLLPPLKEFSSLLEPVTTANAFNLFRLDQRPEVFVVDFASPYEQGRALNRMMTLYEDIRTPRDRLMSETEIQLFFEKNQINPALFNLGHNYEYHQITDFFKQANLSGLRIEEQNLQKKLSENGFFSDRSHVLIALSQNYQLEIPEFSAEEVMALRKAVLSHELSHGFYFVDDLYRQSCEAVWNSLTQAESQSVVDFLKSQSYDINNQFLVMNEFQAFIFHTDHQAIIDLDELAISKSRLALLKQTLMPLPLE